MSVSQGNFLEHQKIFCQGTKAANQYGLYKTVRHRVESATKVIIDKAIVDSTANQNDDKEI